MDAKLKNRLNSFAGDDVSGSAELADEAFAIVRSFCSTASVEEIDSGLSELALALIASQPSMAAVINLVNRACLTVEKVLVSGKPENMTGALDKQFTGTKAGRDAAVANAALTLKDFKRIATYSRSSLVERALFDIPYDDFPPDIVLSESRPGNEGVKLAENLAAEGIRVTMCIDAALPDLIRDADVFICGADAVLANCFYNKIGTELMLKAAEEAHLPIFVLASEDKFLPRNLQRFFKLSERPILNYPELDNPLVDTSCPLFERCDNGLVTYFIASELVSSEEIRDRLFEAPVSRALG